MGPDAEWHAISCWQPVLQGDTRLERRAFPRILSHSSHHTPHHTTAHQVGCRPRAEGHLVVHQVQAQQAGRAPQRRGQLVEPRGADAQVLQPGGQPALRVGRGQLGGSVRGLRASAVQHQPAQAGEPAPRWCAQQQIVSERPHRSRGLDRDPTLAGFLLLRRPQAGMDICMCMPHRAAATSTAPAAAAAAAASRQGCCQQRSCAGSSQTCAGWH